MSQRSNKRYKRGQDAIDEERRTVVKVDKGGKEVIGVKSGQIIGVKCFKWRNDIYHLSIPREEFNYRL